MALAFTNTLTRTKEPFVPIDPHNVRMYVCGPTVYDFAHIGNARPAVVFDVLFRLLRHVYGPEHVTYVRNITDVDDKINARAARDFPDLPLNEAIARVTQKTTAQYHADLAALGCLPPTHEPRATGHIPGMIKMIETLIGKGHAYVADGGEGREVLFDTASMAKYGALSRRKLDEQIAGARVAVDAHKKNPGDFVLWKQSAADEPGWDSPWGRGRPGWHIECSVMSAAHLGETFDIHGGGLDLIFPHHENEIAQSCCAHGTEEMAKFWLHNGFVQVEGRKMSKSEGNFVTIHDVLHTDKVGGRSWPGEVVRLALLMTHYREPLDFSVKRLEEAENVYSRLRQASIRLAEPAVINSLETYPERLILADAIIDPLRDDLDTVGAIRSAQTMARVALTASDDNHYVIWQLTMTLKALGFEKIDVADLPQPERVDPQIAIAVDRRLAFLAAKNFAEADRIRDELLEKGIQLKDGKDPVTGARTTTWEVKR